MVRFGGRVMPSLNEKRKKASTGKLILETSWGRNWIRNVIDFGHLLFHKIGHGLRRVVTEGKIKGYLKEEFLSYVLQTSVN